MQVHHGAAGDRAEKFPDHLRVHVTHHEGCKRRVKREIRPSAQIQCAQCQRLIHRNDAFSESGDSGLVPERFTDRLSQHDPRIFDRVMIVHLQVSIHMHAQVKQPMAGKTCQHMVKKADTGSDIRPACTVKIQRQPDTGFLRYSFNLSSPLHTISPEQLIVNVLHEYLFRPAFMHGLQT